MFSLTSDVKYAGASVPLRRDASEFSRHRAATLKPLTDPTEENIEGPVLFQSLLNALTKRVSAPRVLICAGVAVDSANRVVITNDLDDISTHETSAEIGYNVEEKTKEPQFLIVFALVRDKATLETVNERLNSELLLERPFINYLLVLETFEIAQNVRGRSSTLQLLALSIELALTKPSFVRSVSLGMIAAQLRLLLGDSLSVGRKITCQDSGDEEQTGFAERVYRPLLERHLEIEGQPVRTSFKEDYFSKDFMSLKMAVEQHRLELRPGSEETKVVDLTADNTTGFVPSILWRLVKLSLWGLLCLPGYPLLSYIGIAGMIWQAGGLVRRYMRTRHSPQVRFAIFTASGFAICREDEKYGPTHTIIPWSAASQLVRDRYFSWQPLVKESGILLDLTDVLDLGRYSIPPGKAPDLLTTERSDGSPAFVWLLSGKEVNEKQRSSFRLAMEWSLSHKNRLTDQTIDGEYGSRFLPEARIDAALVIGVGQYNEIQPNLPCAKNDAWQFENLLSSEDERSNVELALNPDLKAFSDATKRLHALAADKNIFVFFAGHAFDVDGNLILGVADSEPNSLASTGVNFLDWLDELLNKKPRSITVFLDCCHGGLGVENAGRLARGNIPINILATVEAEMLAPDTENQGTVFRLAEHLGEALREFKIVTVCDLQDALLGCAKETSKTLKPVVHLSSSEPLILFESWDERYRTYEKQPLVEVADRLADLQAQSLLEIGEFFSANGHFEGQPTGYATENGGRCILIESRGVLVVGSTIQVWPAIRIATVSLRSWAETGGSVRVAARLILRDGPAVDLFGDKDWPAEKTRQIADSLQRSLTVWLNSEQFCKEEAYGRLLGLVPSEELSSLVGWDH